MRRTFLLGIPAGPQAVSQMLKTSIASAGAVLLSLDAFGTLP
jgi:hypothetical protein